MKKTFTYLFIAVIFIACGKKTDTRYQTHSSTIISVLLDTTDVQNYYPSADQILRLYKCQQNPTSEFTFRLQTITDRRLNPIATYHLADAESLEKDNANDDPQFREKNILAFYGVVRKAMNNFFAHVNSAHSLNNTECFRTISSELNFLATCGCENRILIVASDLLEKSDLMNCYNTPLSDHLEIEKLLNRENTLPKNLSNISVIFLFDPRNEKEDRIFNSIGDVYKHLLEQRGATVKIQANL